MKISFSMALLPVVAASLLTVVGCATAPRFVSETYWAGSDHLYIAYTEGGLAGSRITKCSRGPDNKLICGDQKDVNFLLEGHEQAAPAAAAAPAATP